MSTSQNESTNPSVKPISISELKKYPIFCGRVEIGEYVSFWVSNDKIVRMGVGICSHPTLEKCENHTPSYLKNQYLSQDWIKELKENGNFEYRLIVAD